MILGQSVHAFTAFQVALRDVGAQHLRLAPIPINIGNLRSRDPMIETGHNLLFQEATLADAASGAERLSFLSRLPNQPKIDAFLRAQDRRNPSPRFAEFFDFRIAVFVAAVQAAPGVRVVVAGVTNVSQSQFDTVAALIGRGTARWNRLEFKSSVESILGISIQDFAAPGR
jgi:hypothetical protein